MYSSFYLSIGFIKKNNVQCKMLFFFIYLMLMAKNRLDTSKWLIGTCLPNNLCCASVFYYILQCQMLKHSVNDKHNDKKTLR